MIQLSNAEYAALVGERDEAIAEVGRLKLELDRVAYESAIRHATLKAIERGSPYTAALATAREALK